MLNGPREINYSFKLCFWDGWAFLFDDSERTYLCSTQPSIYAVPVWKEGLTPWETEDLIGSSPELCYAEPIYLSDQVLSGCSVIDVLEVDKEVHNQEAWCDAHEELVTSDYFYGV